MGNGLLAFAAGLGSGYLSAQQRNKEQERQDKLDAQNKQLFDLKMADATRVNQDRAALSEAGKTATVDNGATMGLADGTNIAYSDPGVANSDFRQLRSADQATGNQTLARAPLVVPPSLADGQVPETRIPGDRSMILPPESTASLADGTMPQAPQRAIVVNGKVSPSLADANTTAAALNTPEARAERQAAALDAMGQPEKAAALRAGGKQAKLADFQLSTAQTNHLNELANQKIVERANTNGGDWFKTQADILTETGVGGLAGATAAPRVSADNKTVQIVLTRPDGTEQVVRQYGNDDQGQMRAQQDLMQVNPTVKLQWLHERATTNQKAKTDAADIAHKGAQTNKENAWADALKPGGTKDVSASKLDRMTEGDKMTLANINKQRDMIQQAIVKAQAEGSYDAATPNSIALTKQMAAFGIQAKNILAQYGDGVPSPDKLGVRKPAPAASSDAVVTPQQQKANDSDRPTIMADELKSAQTRLAAGDPRAQGDIDALTKEIARLPKTAPANQAQKGVPKSAPVVKPAPKAAANPPPPLANFRLGPSKPAQVRGLANDLATARINEILAADPSKRQGMAFDIQRSPEFNGFSDQQKQQIYDAAKS